MPGANLGPTDGRIGLGIGGTYTTPEGVEISGGIQYSWLGNTITDPAVGTGTFVGNTTIAAGVTVGFSFYTCPVDQQLSPRPTPAGVSFCANLTGALRSFRIARAAGP